MWLTADGTSWDQVSITDFSSNNNCVSAMSSFNPYASNQQLYIGTDNEKGAEVWMTGNGIDWVLLEDNGIGDKITPLFAVWRYLTIAFTWEQIISKAGHKFLERKAVLASLRPIRMDLVMKAIKQPILCVTLKVISM